MKALRRIQNEPSAAGVRWYLAQRGKHRRHLDATVGGLQDGLLQFYQVTAGMSHVRSWNETELLPDNPFLGFGDPYSEGASGGSYNADDLVAYFLLPYGENDGRIYAGISHRLEVVTVADDAILWPAWTESPGWVTGFTVLRHVNDSPAGYRDVNAATMFGGWRDDNTGWSAAALPFDFDQPPTVAKVLWNVLEEFAFPQTMATVPWSGGTAFSTVDDLTQLIREICDDLRRSVTGTLAFWVCPLADGSIAALSGDALTSFRIPCSAAGSGLAFGDSGQVFIDGHESGDWYLLVLRNDEAAGTLTIDVIRQRDGVQVSANGALPAYCGPLTGADDYLAEGLGATLSIGGPWFTDVGVPGYFDRIGLWNRRLTEAEVLELFNDGAGWLPV
jgi:hypothetical protein